MPKERTLSVVANKYLAVDADGRPCGLAYRVDTGRPEPIGAVLVPPTKEQDKRGDELVYEFSDEPVTIPDRIEHRRLLQNRLVLPADEATARVVGLEFIPVGEALETARKAAAERYLGESGEESEHLRVHLPPPKAPPTTGKSPSVPALPIPSTAADKSKDG